MRHRAGTVRESSAHLATARAVQYPSDNMKTARYRDNRPTIQAPHRCACGYPIQEMTTHCVGCELTRRPAMIPPSVPRTAALYEAIEAEFMRALAEGLALDEIPIIEA